MAKAKKVKKYKALLHVDRLLMVTALAAATSYIVRGTWAAVIFEAVAIVLGILWAARAVMTNPAREFRLLATLILALITCLLAVYLGIVNGLL